MNTIPNPGSFCPPENIAAEGMAPMPVITLMEEAEDDLEDFEQRYRGLMDVCGLVRFARLRLVAQMKERES